MKIGVLKEIKDGELRVALTPDAVKELVDLGHIVNVEIDAGLGSGYSNVDYLRSLYTENGEYHSNVTSKETVWDCDIILKVKEPEPTEYQYFKKNSTLICFFHFAGTPGLQEALDAAGTNYFELESLEGTEHHPDNPLKEMGTIAGEEAYKIGKELFDKNNTRQLTRVCIIGVGHVGKAAKKLAEKDSMDVIAIDKDSKIDIGSSVMWSDLIITSAYMPLQKAPVLITEDMVSCMHVGAVIMDIAIDQGGNVQTSRPTTHSEPTFEKHGIIHYCVPNIPGRVPQRATIALSEAILNYVIDSL